MSTDHFAPITPDTEARLYEAGAALLQVGKEIVEAQSGPGNPMLNTSIATAGMQGLIAAGNLGGMFFEEMVRGAGAGLGYFMGPLDDATTEGLIEVLVLQLRTSMSTRRLALAPVPPGKPN